MLDEKGKHRISLSSEQKYLIKAHLIQSGVPEPEAEELSNNYTSIKEALRASLTQSKYSHPTLNREFYLILQSEAYEDIINQFPPPRLLESSSEPCRPLSELSKVYLKKIGYAKGRKEQKQEEEKKSFIMQKEEENKQKTTTLREKITDYALTHGLDKDQADAISVVSKNFEAAKSLIDKTMQQRNPRNVFQQFPNLQMGLSQTHGEIFNYHRGLNLDTTYCTICREEFLERQKLRSLYCFHSFHDQCIDKCLKNGINKCPNCGREVDALDRLVH